MKRIFLLILIIFSQQGFSAPNNFSNLESIKELYYEYPKASDYWKRTSELRNNKDEFYRMKDMVDRANRRIQNKILSWIFLLEASGNNPLFSIDLFKLVYKQPECLKRYFAEILEDELKKMDSNYARMWLLQSLLPDAIKNPDVYLTERKINLFKPFVFEGTTAYRSALGNGPTYLGTMGQNVSAFTSLVRNIERAVVWQMSGEEDSRDRKRYSKYFLEDLERIESCDSPLTPAIQLPWLDYEEMMYIIRREGDTEELFYNLNNLFQTSYFPEFVNHSPVAYALHPQLGLDFMPKDEKVSKNFYKAFWKYIPEIAYQKTEKSSSGYISPKNCKEITRPLFFAQQLGVVVEDEFALEKLGITKDIFKEWMGLQALLSVAEYNEIPYCASALRFLEAMWPVVSGLPSPYATVKFARDYKKTSFKITHPTIKGEWKVKVNLSRKVYKNQRMKKPSVR